MKNKSKINKLISGVIIFTMITFNFGFAFGEGESIDSVTTTTIQYGPTGPVGPTEPVGPTGPVGPTEPVGPTGPVGPTSTPGPTPEESQLAPLITSAPTSEGVVSGLNDTSYNSGDGTIASGDGNVSAGTLNVVGGAGISGNLLTGNNSTPTVQGNIYLNDLLGQGLVSSNSQTGASSANTSDINAVNNLLYSGSNTVLLTNNVPLDINTGNNTANYNTGNGTVTSGDVNLGLNIVNLLQSGLISDNVELAVLNVYGDYTGNIIVPESQGGSSTGGAVAGAVYVIDSSNQNTGYNSVNDSNVNLLNSLKVVDSSQYSILNNIPIYINTGNNSADYNTGNSTVSSGGVTLKTGNAAIFNVIFDGNTWYLVLVNVLGDWAGSTANIPNSATLADSTTPSNVSLGSSNSDTGASSINESNINVANNANIVTTNDLNVANNYEVNINTGNNSADYNTGNGSVVSGNVNILANFINFIGSQIKADKIKILVANIFGNWFGGINYGDKKVVTVTPEANTTNLATNMDITHVDSGGKVTQKSYSSNSSAQSGLSQNVDVVVPSSGEPMVKIQSVNYKPTVAKTAQDSNGFVGTLREVAKVMIFLALVLLLTGMSYQRKYSNKVIKK